MNKCDYHHHHPGVKLRGGCLLGRARTGITMIIVVTADVRDHMSNCLARPTFFRMNLNVDLIGYLMYILYSIYRVVCATYFHVALSCLRGMEVQYSCRELQQV